MRRQDQDRDSCRTARRGTELGEHLCRTRVSSGNAARAVDRVGSGVGLLKRCRQVEAANDGAGDGGIFAGVCKPERRAPRALEAQSGIFGEHPGHANFWIAGAAIERAAVLVVTPRNFEFQPSEEWYGIVIAEDGDVELNETGPNVIRLGIDARYRGGQIGSARIVVSNEMEIDTGVAGANRRLHLASRQIEERAIELHTLFVNPHLLIEGSCAADIIQGVAGVALEYAGIAEQVQIGNGGRLGQLPNAGAVPDAATGKMVQPKAADTKFLFTAFELARRFASELIE